MDSILEEMMNLNTKQILKSSVMSKVITVPKDSEALAALDYDQATVDQLIELKIDDNAFNALDQKGFFLLINKIAGTLIDNYEDEVITDADILKHVLASKVFGPDYYDDTLKEMIENIKSLFLKAIEFGTGVFFYF